MYTCGPTVYSRPHIGNYASFLMADLLRRWLEAGHGYQVKHVKNITDVGHLLHDADQGDDKIQKEAEKEKIHPLEIAKRYTDQYLEDERALNMLEPLARPRATSFVEQMKTMIEELLKRGFAYVTEDGIYFDVTSKTRTPYGALSGNTLDKVASGSRVAVNEQKKHPSDFALWKFCVGHNSHHILRWVSPNIPASMLGGIEVGIGFGSIQHSIPIPLPGGFPGWHIECSAMSRALLGDTVDIHTGGEDNIFPHHECEIAQSEQVTQKPFVRLFLHKRRIDLGDQKMSKSLGNVLNLSNIIDKGYSPLDLRYYLLSVHYRTPLKFSWKGMDDAKKARRKIMEWTKRVTVQEHPSPSADHVRQFSAAMDDDLNTPAALAVIFEAMKSGEPTQEFVDMIRHTFGCFEVEEGQGIPENILELKAQRQKARDEKKYEESDRLRKLMEEQGYEVRDVKGDQVVKRK
jgi:cysteinyl-tRNA synthetase